MNLVWLAFLLQNSSVNSSTLEGQIMVRVLFRAFFVEDFYKTLFLGSAARSAHLWWVSPCWECPCMWILHVSICSAPVSLSVHEWLRQSRFTSGDDSVTPTALEFVFADAVRVVQQRTVVWTKFITQTHSWQKEKTFLGGCSAFLLKHPPKAVTPPVSCLPSALL